MPDTENWMLVAAILAVPVVIFGGFELLLRYLAHRRSNVVSSRTRMSRRRR